MSEEGGKVTGIWHIIRLREMLQKWQSNTKAAASSTAKATRPLTGISPAVNKRLIRESRHNVSDSEDESCQSPEHPSDVPKGYLAVYVGTELRRFIIPTSYLSLPVFKVLLEKAEEEFGFDHNGALKLPCEIETFKYILQTIKNDSNCLPCNENPSNLEDE